MRLATALARRRLGRPGLAAAGFCWRLSLKPRTYPATPCSAIAYDAAGFSESHPPR